MASLVCWLSLSACASGGGVGGGSASAEAFPRSTAHSSASNAPKVPANTALHTSAQQDLVDLPTESDETQQRRRARLRLELAAAYLQEGQPRIALDEIKQALQIDPRYADAFNLRGLAYLRLSNLAQARESFVRALVLQPQDATANHNLALLQCQQGLFADAERLFRLAMAQPEHAGQARNWVALALCQASAGQAAQAEASLVSALRVEPHSAAANFHMARLLFERGQAQAAQAYVRKLNSEPAANAASLWLGIRIEHQLQNLQAVHTLAAQLRERFAQSPELIAYDKGAFRE